MTKKSAWGSQTVQKHTEALVRRQVAPLFRGSATNKDTNYSIALQKLFLPLICFPDTELVKTFDVWY